MLKLVATQTVDRDRAATNHIELKKGFNHMTLNPFFCNYFIYIDLYDLFFISEIAGKQEIRSEFYIR